MPSKICRSCVHIVTNPVRESRGSGCVCIALLFLFFFPGIIYLIWMLCVQDEKCDACGSTTLIPLETPVGMRLYREIYGDAGKHEEVFSTRKAG